MPDYNEVVDAVLSELDKFGLKGELLDRAKHQEVVWVLPGGAQRSVICPKTPSDHRAWLNQRAVVRRMLRADNVQPPTRNVLSLNHALQAPKQVGPDPLGLRVQQLERDRDALLDLYADLTAEAEALKQKLTNLRVTVSFDAPLVEAPASRPSATAVRFRKSFSEGPSAKIMAALADGRWHSKDELRKATGLVDKHLSSTLSYLRRDKGSVENGQRGWWRKVAESQLEVPKVQPTYFEVNGHGYQT